MSKIKKKLLGYNKTKHFKKRQVERDVSDLQILKAFKKGHITESDGTYRIVNEHLNIILDFDNETLITVHPGDPSKNKSKILSKEQANQIKSLIAEQKAEEGGDEDPFAIYLKENSVKKLF